MLLKHKGIVEELASEAIRLGADMLEVEYKDGYEEVFALKGSVGYGIARLPSSSGEAASLRDELYGITKKKRARDHRRLRLRAERSRL